MQQQGTGDPVRDIVLQVQGQMQGVDTTLTDETGQRANIRQVTIILSLGIAQANSGLNNAIGVQLGTTRCRPSRERHRASTGTGDALAANDGLVIICQRRNAEVCSSHWPRMAESGASDISQR